MGGGEGGEEEEEGGGGDAREEEEYRPGSLLQIQNWIKMKLEIRREEVSMTSIKVLIIFKHM